MQRLYEERGGLLYERSGNPIPIEVRGGMHSHDVSQRMNVFLFLVVGHFLLLFSALILMEYLQSCFFEDGLLLTIDLDQGTRRIVLSCFSLDVFIPLFSIDCATAYSKLSSFDFNILGVVDVVGYVAKKTFHEVNMALVGMHEPSDFFDPIFRPVRLYSSPSMFSKVFAPFLFPLFTYAFLSSLCFYVSSSFFL